MQVNRCSCGPCERLRIAIEDNYNDGDVKTAEYLSFILGKDDDQFRDHIWNQIKERLSKQAYGENINGLSDKTKPNAETNLD